MGEVTKPELPAGTPRDVADFVGCTGLKLSVGTGKAGWLRNLFKDAAAEWGLDADKLPEPSTKFEPGTKPGRVKASVSVDLGITVSFSVEVWVENGQLKIDASSLPAGQKRAEEWVKQLNEWLKQNGKAFGNILVAGGTATATKITVGVPANGQGPKAAEPPKVEPPKVEPPKVGPGTTPGIKQAPAEHNRVPGLLWLVPGLFVFLVAVFAGMAYQRINLDQPVVSEVAADVRPPVDPVQLPVEPKPVDAPKPVDEPSVDDVDPLPPVIPPTPPQLFGFCQGVKHNGPGDSKELVAISSNISGTATVDIKSPTGDLEITIQLTDGKGQSSAPIDTYGTYSVEKITMEDGTVIDASKIPGYRPQTIGTAEATCTAEELPVM